MDKAYWKNYYKSNQDAQSPSLFAQFILDNHLNDDDSLIELGCGNGRDSVFFARHGIKTHAIDQCEEEIEALRKEHTLPNIKFESADFTKLDDSRGTFDHVYSRFTMHTIRAHEEDRVIDWAYKTLKPNGKFHIEARGYKNELHKLGESVPDEPDAYIYNDHFRRFINMDRFIKKLEDKGFKILLSEETTGFAPFQDTDYHFMRILALK